MATKYLVRDEDQDVTIEIQEDGRSVRARREGDTEWKHAELSRVGESGLYLLMLENRPIELYLERRRGGAVVTIGRHTFDYDVGAWRPAQSRPQRETASTGRHNLTAPMTGSIVEVRCQPGERVSRGQVLLVMESMKMNNELRSPVDATVEAVPLEPGQRVGAGDLLVALRPIHL